MAQVDASIPLQVQQIQLPDQIKQTEQMYQLKDLADQDTQRKQAIQQQQALQDAYRSTDMSQPDAEQKLIQKVSQINPQMGQKLQKDIADRDKTKAETAKYQSEAQEKQLAITDTKMGHINDGANDILNQYNAISTKAGPAAAWAQMQPIIQQKVQQLQMERGPDGKPLYTPDELKNLAGVQNPQQLTEAAHRSHQYLEQRKDQRAEEELKDKERHEKVTEGQEGARLGIERERLSMSKGSDSATSEQAKAIAEGRAAPLTGNALRTPYGQSVMDKVYQQNPKYDSTIYAERTKAVRDFSTGKQGQAIASFNTAISHLDTLNELADALDNGNVQVINSVKNKVATQFGDPSATSFNGAKKIVTDEVVKAIVGAGGGVADREEAARVINDAESPKQIKAAIKTVTKLMGGKLAGLETQYKSSTKNDDFESMLEPDAVKAYKEFKGSKGASESSAHPADIDNILDKYK